MDKLLPRLRVSPRTLTLYVTIYLTAGFIMNGFGKAMAIAEFGHWWQVLTCYGVYLIPCSLYVREKSAFDQYLYGLLFLGVLEMLGYSFGTSIAHPGNILDVVLTERNFSLAMTLFFAVIPPVGNWGVAAVEALVFGRVGEAQVAPEPVEAAPR